MDMFATLDTVTEVDQALVAEARDAFGVDDVKPLLGGAQEDGAARSS